MLGTPKNEARTAPPPPPGGCMFRTERHSPAACMCYGRVLCDVMASLRRWTVPCDGLPSAADWAEVGVWLRLTAVLPTESRRAGLLDLDDYSVYWSHVRPSWGAGGWRSPLSGAGPEVVRILVWRRRFGSCCGCSASDCERAGPDGADGWLPGRWISGIKGVVVDP